MSNDSTDDMVTLAADEWQFPGDEIFPWASGNLHDGEARTWVRTLIPGVVYYGRVLPSDYEVEVFGELGSLTTAQQKKIYGRAIFEAVQ